ncbi:MAG: putative dsRNA-binding protein [Myxococcota bacterium]
MHFQLKTWFHGVGLELADSPLFERALIHSSYVAEHPEHPELRDNRRLEFVGRPLLLTAISLLLQDHLTDQTYETLESVRNTLASDAMLAEVGRRHHLGKALLISTELAYEGGRDRDQVLAQGVAAVSTAVYVQGGMPALEKLLRPMVLEVRLNPMLYLEQINPKGELLQLIQKQRLPAPNFREIASWGVPHLRQFKVGLYVHGELLEQGEGSSLKLAEQAACRKALRRLSRDLVEDDGGLTYEPSALIKDRSKIPISKEKPDEPLSMHHLIEAVTTVTPETWDEEDEDQQPLDPVLEHLRPGQRLSRAQVEQLETNPKGLLIDLCRQRSLPDPEFRVRGHKGPAHAPLYHVTLFFGGRQVGQGEGRSRKEAEMIVARAWIESWLNLDRGRTQRA